MRLRIRQNMASLLMMKTLATEESLALDQKIDISRVTKREVDEIKEEQNEEGHFYKVFGKANIQINSSGGQNGTLTDRIMEHKCCGCAARLMSIKNLNTHTQNCEHVAINNFFTALKELYSHRESQKLTKVEFIHHAFRLIFDTTKHLQKISKAKGINVNAVTSEMPQINMENYQYDTRVNNLKRNFKTKSPDNGYASGGSPNYNQRF